VSLFGVVAGINSSGCSHGAWLDGSWWFDRWRMMMVHSLVYMMPLDVAFLGHCAWLSGRRLGFLQIYSLILGGRGIVLINHGT